MGLGLQVRGAETDPAKYSSYTCFPVFVLNSSSFATSVALTEVCALVLTETVHRCLQHKSPQNLRNYCVPVSEVVSRQHLRSAARHQLLLIPRSRLGTFCCRPITVADLSPTFWNSLADELRTYSSDGFKAALKTFLFATYSRI